MRWSLDADSSHGCTWESLLLTGLLLTSCVCCTSSELSSTWPADVQLPVPGNLHGEPSRSWIRGHQAGPGDMMLPADGLPGPSHTDQETEDTPGRLDMRDVVAHGSVAQGSRRERRGAQQQGDTRASSMRFFLWSHPDSKQGGVVQSDLNYSVCLRCSSSSSLDVDNQLRWTFNGKPNPTGQVLCIRRLAREHLGTYVCVYRNGTQQFSSEPRHLVLSEVDPTDPGMREPYSSLYLTGGPAIGLLVGGILGALALFGGIVFTVIQQQRSNRGNCPQRCC
ncbi:immunoglobulin superfamily member 23 isoform X2 [Erinaceus europaeus]|uniref:immunoglobulin superfamily member 23 isoform X2 n=1 Tax=Erinaceus europaeus TaxID=9365 RepID=UPI0028FC836D|nr:immunoglobulin superfamily member 23 isoform X2 [Erinaceus europaeus]